MTKHIQPANKCRLGQSLFSGGTVLADGMVHAHFDPFDYCLGASSIQLFEALSKTATTFCTNDEICTVYFQ
jgi:hypothetical protein